MTSEILRAREWIARRRGEAKANGIRDDGSARVVIPLIHLPPETWFRAPAGEARDLIADGRAEAALLTGQNLALANAVLDAPDALAAVRAAMAVQSPGGHPAFRAWHAERGEDHLWRPAPMPGLGLARSRFDAAFRNSDEAAAIWTKHPGATPLFVFDHPTGFIRAFIWRAGGILEIPTEIYPLRG